MRNAYKIFLLLSIISLSCEKDCKTKNPNNLSLNGCGDFMVYEQINVNGNVNSYIIIEVVRDELILDNNFRSFDIITSPFITAYIDELTKEGNNYCTDAIDTEIQVIKRWEIVSGTAEIRIVREINDCDNTYVVNVILRNAIFSDAEANNYAFDYKEFKNVLVNYIIG
jgi:hypothetical protein